MTRVLIVDDKEDNLYYLKVLLEGHGCAVTTAGHGAEALVKARQSPPDVVISDLLMPVMDGYTLLRHWKADPSLGRLPFIVYTATYTEQADEDLALDMGADAFIRKPAEPEDFLAELHKVRQTAVKRGGLGGDDRAALESYSRLLIRKLEEKTLQLEEANRALQKDVTMRREAEESLRASQAGMIVAQSIAHLGSWEMRLTKPDGTRDHALRWSDEMYRIAGYEPGQVEISNEFFFQLVPPEDHELIRAAFRSTIKEGSTYSIVHRLIRADGEVRIIHAMAQLFREGQSGLPIKMIGAAHDITEERRLAQALETERSMLLEAQTLSKMGTWETNLETMEVRWSDLTHHIFGTSPSEFKPNHESFLEFVHPEDRSAVDTAFKRSMERVGAQEIQHRIIMRDGKVKQVIERWQVFLDDQGKPKRALGTTQDITERVLVEEEMQRTTRLLRAVADGTTDAVFVKDTQGRYLLVNQGTARLVGKTAEEIIGQNDTTIFEPEEAQRVMQNDREVMASGKPSTAEEVLTAAGATRTYLATKAPYRDEQGRVLGIVGISRDISERKRHERHLGVLSGLGQRLNSAASPFAAAEIITQVADELFGWDAATLDLYSEETGKMSSILTVDTIAGKRTHCAPAYDESPPSPKAARVLKEGGHLILRDREGEPANLTDLQRFGDVGRASASLMYVPIRDGSRNIGLLSIQSYRQGAYTNADLQVLQLLADYCGGALHRIQTESLRQLADERFRLLARATNDALWDWNLVTDELWWSDGFELLFGFRVSQVSPTIESWHQLIHPEDRDRVIQLLQQVIDSNAESWSGEYRFRRKAGDYAFVFDRGHILRAADGKAVRMIGGMTDLTERKLAEEKLKVSEERFREMADNIGDIFYNYDPVNNRLLYANQAFERIWGRAIETVYENPLSYLDDIHPSDRPNAERALEQQMAGEQTEAEFRVLRGDGSICWVRELAVPILDQSGKVERIVGTMRDVTERKQAEDRLTEQAALLDNAKDAILVRDLEHRILYWNRGAERLYGWTADEAIGQPVKTLLYKESDSFLEATRTVLECGEWVGEIHQFDRNGKPLIIEGSWTLVCDVDGNPKSILAINTDISERKRLEQQILRVQRMESIGTLAGGMAHDLNNILAPILLSIDLLRIGEQDQRRQGILNAMESSTRRGSELVRQVLSFARGVEGRKMAVCPEELLSEIEKIARETFPKNIEVETCVEPRLMSLTGDPTQLHQVLLNLCVNARDAMPTGGRITLSAYNRQLDERYAGMNPGASVGPHVVLQVEDTGIGMEPATVERIFEPFFTTKEIGKGTGLGLSTTQAIVKSHGGFVRVDSQPGEGTRFRVFLPARPGGEKTGDAEKAAALQRGTGELILVIEDETDVRELVRDTLEAYGYKVLLAGDGAAGVKLYQKQKDAVSVVLTDMMMPGMDGLGVIQAIRSLQPRARIIAASGLTDGSAAAKAGVSHFIPKPFSARTLLEAVSQVLTETWQPQS